MTIMTRPDKLPAGPTEGRFFAVCAMGGFDVQVYPKFKHIVIRLLLIKINKWYGSLFELQCGFDNAKFKINYFDIFFTNYFFEKVKNKAVPAVNFEIFKYISTPWKFTDQYCAKLANAKIWNIIDNLVPKPKSKKRKKSTLLGKTK